jgi:DNA modification methylase
MSNPTSKIYIKDSRDMKEVKDGSVQLIVTSPPYGALKDYKNDGQIGLNQSYSDYISNLNEVWKECIRVLGPDGKLCIDIMPLFESGDNNPFKRRITHSVISDIEKFMDSTGRCLLLDYTFGIREKLLDLVRLVATHIQLIFFLPYLMNGL